MNVGNSPSSSKGPLIGANFLSGCLLAKRAWVPSKEHAWVCTDVVSFLQESAQVQVVNPNDPEGEDLIFKQSEIHLLDETHLLSHDDLCDMNRLHDAP